MSISVTKFYDFYSFEVGRKMYLVKPEHTNHFLDAIICAQHPSCTQEILERRINPVLMKFDPTSKTFAYRKEMVA